MAVCILSAALELYRGSFQWKEPPYEFVTDRLPIDVLFGNSWIREDLENGIHPDQIEAKWHSGLEAFRKSLQKYFLYT